jgi:UDP-N-acetylmuramoyl-L-alanyl-D-glutamate--2,6-diaminopimelate ligase
VIAVVSRAAPHVKIPEWEQVLSAGAAAALVTKRASLDIPQLVVRSGRSATAVAAGEWYGRPAKRLRIVGVTGTNGKTTTVALIRHLLNGDGTVGSIGTLGAVDGAGRSLPGAGPLTTPGPVELQAVLAAMCEQGVRSVVMEASSHALDQERLHTLELAAAVYTNLTHDHLDYHGDFNAYRAAKARLSDLLGPGAVEVVNADDLAWTALSVRPDAARVRFGTGSDADARLLEADPGARFYRLRLLLGEQTVTARFPLFGEFNVSNALSACATAWALGLDPA